MNDSIVPNKSLGQHWLTDQQCLNSIVECARVDSSDLVIEIGPGTGLLTRHLSAAAKDVLAIEFDENLAQKLNTEFADSNVEIINQDIRKFDFSKHNAYKVVGNVPYYLTSYLVRLLIDLENQPQSICLLIQKEVAERIAAQPGKLSVLGVAVQLAADVSLGEVVDAEKFDPPPKVDSQIILIKPKKQIVPFDRKEVMRVVKFGFSNRRKTLVNNLMAGLQCDRAMAERVVEELGYVKTVRAQEIKVDDWALLTELVNSN